MSFTDKIKTTLPGILFGALFLAFLLIFLPVSSPFFEIPYNSKRFFEVLFLCIIGLQILLIRKQWVAVISTLRCFPRNIRYGLTCIVLLGIVSAFLSNHWMYAFLEIGVFLLLFILLLVVVQHIKNDEKGFFAYFGVVLFLIAGFYFVRFTITYLYSFFIPGWPIWPNIKFLNLVLNGEAIYPEPFLGFVHVRFLNHLHTWTLPLFVLFSISIQKKFWVLKSITVFLTGFWWMLVFAADARGTMLASAVSFITVFVLYKSEIKRWGKLYIGTLAAGLAGYLLLFKLLISEGSRTVLSRYGDSGRLQMWENAADLITSNPFFGVGPMHYADALNGFKFAAPHNIYLQIISEWGIPVFIILSIIIAIALLKWFKFEPQKTEIKGVNTIEIKAALSASILAALIHGFFSGIINTPLSQLMMVLVLAWAIGFYQSHSDLYGKENVLSGNKSILILRVFILIVIVFVSWATIISYQGLDKNRSIYLEQSERNTLYPRFWDHGIIDGNNELKIINIDVYGY